MQCCDNTSGAQIRNNSDRLTTNHHCEVGGHPFDVPLHRADQYRERGGPFPLFVLGI
jgi:hypothetical protein